MTLTTLWNQCPRCGHRLCVWVEGVMKAPASCFAMGVRLCACLSVGDCCSQSIPPTREPMQAGQLLRSQVLHQESALMRTTKQQQRARQLTVACYM
eukprot:4592479-Amphidinium_carterae.1